MVLVVPREIAHYGETRGILVRRWWREASIEFGLVLDEVAGGVSELRPWVWSGMADFLQEVEE